MRRVVIIGAGFSGTVAAVEFMRHAPQGAELILVNRSGKMARGLAYGTSSPHHLLNVPAGNMSALQDDPDSFLRFCRRLDNETHSGSFVSRSLYGVYLEELLTFAESQSAGRVTCRRVAGNVLSVEKKGSEVLLEMACGAKILADHVILALGNFAPSNPLAVNPQSFSPFYIADPWLNHLELAHKNAPRVLLIGTGLTAVDVLLSIKRSLPSAQVFMVSRRGLHPKAHRDQLPADGFTTDVQSLILNAEPTVRTYLRIVRECISISSEHWREVITALRNITPELWSRLPLIERRRFLRHLQVYWDSHRHRIAPETSRIFEAGIQDSSVELIAGRVTAVEIKGDVCEVDVARRGSERVYRVAVNKIINCTGPCTSLSRIEDELMRSLVSADIISSDKLGLGINVSPGYEVLSSQGIATPWLSYVGPMLKATYWEATAVPELRVHAKALVIEVMRRLSAAP